MSLLKLKKIVLDSKEAASRLFLEEYSIYNTLKNHYPTLIGPTDVWEDYKYNWGSSKIDNIIRGFIEVEKQFVLKPKPTYTAHYNATPSRLNYKRNYIFWDSGTIPDWRPLVEKINAACNVHNDPTIKGEYVYDELFSLNLSNILEHEVNLYYNKEEDLHILCIDEKIEKYPLALYTLNYLYWKNRNEDLAKFYLALSTEDIDTVNSILEDVESILDEKVFEFINIENFGDIQKKQRNLKSQIEDIERNASYYADELTRCIKMKKEKNLELTTLNNIDTTKQEESLENFKNYLKEHKYLKIYTWQKPILSFEIQIPITYYDSDLAEIVINNHFDSEWAPHKIFTDIFVNSKYKLLTWTIIDFDTETFNINVSEDVSNESYTNYYPHPHMNAFDCVGNFREAVENWSLNNDYIGACEQIVSMACNLNFADAIVVDNFFSKIQNEHDTVACFQDVETGACYSYEDLREIYSNDEEEE